MLQVYLVKEWRNTSTDVGDQQSLVVSLRQSAHFGMFQDHIEGWEKRLAVLQEALGSMAAVQRKWLYLEPVFARGALPDHAPRFRQVRRRPLLAILLASHHGWQLLWAIHTLVGFLVEIVATGSMLSLPAVAHGCDGAS